MPSSSKKQHNFMAAVAHSPSFAKKVGVPQSVGKDFTAADKGKKFMNPRARRKGGALGYASGGKIDWSANEANAVKGGEKSYLPKSPKKPITKNLKGVPGKPSRDIVPSAFRAGLRPGTREFSEFIGSGGESNTRDAITAKAKSQGVKFDKFGRVKMAEGGKVQSDSSSFDEDQETESRREAREADEREQRRATREADTQHRTNNEVEDDSEIPEEAPKAESFGKWFNRQKEGSVATWTNPKTGEQKRIKILKGKPESSTSTSPSTSSTTKSHRTSGAGTASYKPATNSSVGSRFLDNAKNYGKDAASAALKKNPKLSAPKDEPLEESHPEDYIGIGKAVAGLGTAAYAAKKYGPRILSNMMKIEGNVAKRAARGARSEAFINTKARQRAVSVNSFKKQATKNNLKNLKSYEDTNKEAYRGMKRGGQVSRYCGGGMTKRYAAGGFVSSVSSRADGIASRGRTKCKIR